MFETVILIRDIAKQSFSIAWVTVQLCLFGIVNYSLFITKWRGVVVPTSHGDVQALNKLALLAFTHGRALNV